jgi:TPR repeat protein
LQYFKKAASLGDAQGNFSCYALLDYNDIERYEYLSKALVMGLPKAFGTFGYLISKGRINDISKNYKSAY